MMTNKALDDLALRLHACLPSYCSRYVDAAVAGDPEAAFSLSIAAPNAYRGALVVAFWECGVAMEAFREILASVWDHDHAFLLRAARTRTRLKAMFVDAAFPLPKLPETLSVWRGTNGVSRARATRGIAWTLDRDTACWFAMRFAKIRGRKPLVLRAAIPSTSVAMYHNERDEKEVIVFDVRRTIIDGAESDWREAAERRSAATQASNEKMVNTAA